MEYKTILYYKYVHVEHPHELRKSQIALCEELNLKCRIIVANEGINGTLEGKVEDVDNYIKTLRADERFSDIHIKSSKSDGNAFPRISVKRRDELVSGHLGEDDVNPNEVTGKYITPDELRELFESGEEFYMVDMRNDYEHKVGYFKNSVLPSLRNFRDLPEVLDELEHLKDKKVVTYCTGGIRCEKASGYLITQGFSDVYQLKGGIHTYIEKYPNEDFLGKLYVFDGRVTMGFNTDSDEHEIVGTCDFCDKKCDIYRDCDSTRCNSHMVICKSCLDDDGSFYCCDKCREFQKAYIASENSNTANSDQEKNS